MKKKIALLCAASAACMAADAAWAQAVQATEQPPAQAEETATADPFDAGIVVTANRREQNLQDVGIAVAAISGDSLRARGITSSTEISQLTPGIYTSGSLGGQSQQFTICGVTQSDFNDGIEAPVAVYIDGLYIPTQQGQTMALFDVARVEMLKGPQGTLFGRNATGGLVQTIITQPELGRFGGSASVSYGRFNEVKGEAALNAPLGEKAALRVSGYYSRIDNYWKNVYPKGLVPGALPFQNFGPPGARPSPCCENEGGSRTIAGRAQLKLEPTDALTLRFEVQGADQDLSSAPYTSAATIGTYDTQGRLIQADRVSSTETRLAIGPDGQNYPNFAVIPFASFGFPGNGTRAPGATWFGYVLVDPKKLELTSDYARSRLNTASGVSGSFYLDYDFGAATLSSITGYQHYKKEFLMDADGSPSNLFLFGTKANTKAFSQELRLAGSTDNFRWTVGGYFLDVKADTTQGLLGPKGSLLSALFGLQAVGVDAVDVLNLDTRSVSAFGQIEYDITPKLTIILGGRAIRETQTYDFVSFAAQNLDDYRVDDTVALFPLQPSYNNHRVQKLWAGKAQVEFRPIDKLLVYVGINRGVKAGSYNAPLPDGSPPLSPAQMAYRPEVITNYEGGFKYGDRFFSLNASGFYYDYKDYQAFLFTSISGFVQNVNSKVKGFEVDMGLQVTPDLRLQLGGSYTHARIRNFQIAPGVLRTVRPTYAPETQLNAAVTYIVPTQIAGGSLQFDANVNYASGFYHNIRNFNADWFKGRTITNLNVSWTQPGTGLSLSAYLKNAFDKRYGSIGFDSTANMGGNIESFGMPRTFGASVGYRF
ncbi:TonB-dependent receptor [Sphingopyxis granuli]|uniref:TonB-dependent receptor n=1 Tax=Sphingopyxis granuli TaxID=267128 RepID=UPI001BAFF196|nr:TonB-dependent receptor [Sphingopyxis granuli]QUM70998.1 TonB-dependent receptor [Sphingopyxis granuli]